MFVASVAKVTGADEGELVVVKFFAPWCRACRGLEPKHELAAFFL